MWRRPSWVHESRGNFIHWEKTVRCSEVASRDVGLEPFFLPNCFMRRDMHSTRWRPQDAHSSFCWASLAINLPVFVYKKPPQGTTKCEVCVNMTYRVPHRFRRPACPDTHTRTHTKGITEAWKKKKKKKALTISDFREPGSSDQTSWVLCSELTELLSAQWQAIPLSPVYPSVSFRPRSPPDSSLSTLWCYLLLQLAIIPSALQQRIHSLLHNLLGTPTTTVATLPHVPLLVSLSLSHPRCMWIDELLLCWMSGCLTEDTPAAGGTPGDERWLHVPATSAWWRWSEQVFPYACVPDERRPLILTSHFHSVTEQRGR